MHSDPAKTGAPFGISLQDLPEIIPVFPLSGVLLLPRGRLPLNIFEPRYLAMVEAAMAEKRIVGMIQPVGEKAGDKPPEQRKCVGVGAEGQPKLFHVGCAGRIHSFNETEDGRFLISLIGVCRYRIMEEMPMLRGYRRMRVDWESYAADLGPKKSCQIDRTRLLGHLNRYFNLKGFASEWDMIEKTDDEKLITALAMVCPFTPCEKQALLEVNSMEECCTLLNTLMDMAALEGIDAEEEARH